MTCDDGLKPLGAEARVVFWLSSWCWLHLLLGEVTVSLHGVLPC